MADTVIVEYHSPVGIRKIVRRYGYPPARIRSAIVSMRRRGMGYKQAVRAVTTVNAATAHENWVVARDEQLIMQQVALEHSLATAFVTMQRERVPQRRQELWFECLRLAAEIERLNDATNNENSLRRNDLRLDT